ADARLGGVGVEEGAVDEAGDGRGEGARLRGLGPSVGRAHTQTGGARADHPLERALQTGAVRGGGAPGAGPAHEVLLFLLGHDSERGKGGVVRVWRVSAYPRIRASTRSRLFLDLLVEVVLLAPLPERLLRDAQDTGDFGVGGLVGGEGVADVV